MARTKESAGRINNNACMVLPDEIHLSHANGLIACAVVLNRDIGIDAEDMKRREVSLGIADDGGPAIYTQRHK